MRRTPARNVSFTTSARRRRRDAVVGDASWHYARPPISPLGRRQCWAAASSACPRRGCCRIAAGRWRSTRASLPPHTTSNVAGALWSPTSVYNTKMLTPAFEARHAEAARLSHAAFQRLVGGGYGVRWIERSYLNEQPIELPSYVKDAAGAVSRGSNAHATRAFVRCRTCCVCSR